MANDFKTLPGNIIILLMWSLALLNPSNQIFSSDLSELRVVFFNTIHLNIA